MSEQNQILSNSKTMVAMTSISRVFGLARDQMIAYLLGTSRWADVWILAFMIPNMFRRLIAEGAMSTAFVPIFSNLTELQRDVEAEQFMRAIFSLLMLAISLLVAFMILVLPLVLPLLLSFTRPADAVTDGVHHMLIAPTRLMFPYLLFISLAAICQGILNVHNRFALSAATPIVLNLCIISCGYLLRNWGDSPIWGLCIGVLLGGFCQLFLQWLHLFRLGFRVLPTVHFWSRRTVEAVRLWVPTVFSAGVVQVNALVSTLVAAHLMVGAAAAVSVSNRLMELVLGVFVVAVSTSLLPVLARQWSRRDGAAMGECLFGALEMMSMVALPAAAGLILCGPSLISVLFERGLFNRDSVEMTYLALIFHGMAILPICWYRITIQAFYASKQVKIAVWIAVAGALVNIGCCYLLPSVLAFPHAGVAAATLLSSWVLYALARWQLGRCVGVVWPARLNRELLKMLLATLAMVLVWLPLRIQILPLYLLLWKILLSVLVYLAVARMLGVASLAKLMHK